MVNRYSAGCENDVRMLLNTFCISPRFAVFAPLFLKHHLLSLLSVFIYCYNAPLKVYF